MKRFLTLVLGLLLPIVVLAQDVTPNFVEGVNYTRLPQPVRTADPSRIEVVEVFWYGCIHCFHLDPLIKEWRKQLPADVDFHRSPAIWNPMMAIHAQAFYAAQALGVLEKMHDPLFSAMNVDRKPLKDEDELADFFARNGVDEAKFRKAFNSFGVQSNVKQADARARGYRITGTPEMVVNGKYTVSARSAGGPAEIFQVVNFLLAKERAAKAAAAQ